MAAQIEGSSIQRAFLLCRWDGSDSGSLRHPTLGVSHHPVGAELRWARHQWETQAYHHGHDKSWGWGLEFGCFLGFSFRKKQELYTFLILSVKDFQFLLENSGITHWPCNRICNCLWDIFTWWSPELLELNMSQNNLLDFFLPDLLFPQSHLNRSILFPWSAGGSPPFLSSSQRLLISYQVLLILNNISPAFYLKVWWY